MAKSSKIVQWHCPVALPGFLRATPATHVPNTYTDLPPQHFQGLRNTEFVEEEFRIAAELTPNRYSKIKMDTVSFHSPANQFRYTPLAPVDGLFSPSHEFISPTALDTLGMRVAALILSVIMSYCEPGIYLERNCAAMTRIGDLAIPIRTTIVCGSGCGSSDDCCG